MKPSLRCIDRLTTHEFCVNRMGFETLMGRLDDMRAVDVRGLVLAVALDHYQNNHEDHPRLEHVAVLVEVGCSAS